MYRGTLGRSLGSARVGVLGVFFFSSRRRHTRFDCDWSSDVCSSDLLVREEAFPVGAGGGGAVMVTAACAFLEESATLVAVTAKVPALLPAVYRPAEETVPPVADQVTLEFDGPVTAAANCCLAPG